MVVPINLLKPILDDLLTRGNVAKAPRPWLGVFSAESNGDVVVMSVADKGPAAEAGLREGDVISDVGDVKVAGLADFYRRYGKAARQARQCQCGSCGMAARNGCA
jgi:S1-C subfamily serine protease